VRARAQGQLTACKSNLKNIGTAMEMYSTDYAGKYPPAGLALLTPNYLKTIPECPAAGRPSYVCHFGPSALLNEEKHEDYYLIECKGDHHLDIIRQADYPKYNGVVGLIER
jgi:hypothetical protein